MTAKRKLTKARPKHRTPWTFYTVLALSFVLAMGGGLLLGPFVIPHLPILKEVEGYKVPTVYKHQMDCSRFFKENLL